MTNEMHLSEAARALSCGEKEFTIQIRIFHQSQSKKKKKTANLLLLTAKVCIPFRTMQTQSKSDNLPTIVECKSLCTLQGKAKILTSTVKCKRLYTFQDKMTTQGLGLCITLQLITVSRQLKACIVSLLLQSNLDHYFDLMHTRTRNPPAHKFA